MRQRRNPSLRGLLQSSGHGNAFQNNAFDGVPLPFAQAVHYTEQHQHHALVQRSTNPVFVLETNLQRSGIRSTLQDTVVLLLHVDVCSATEKPHALSISLSSPNCIVCNVYARIM